MQRLTPISSRVAHRGRVFEVRADRVATPAGGTVDMDVIRHPGAAAVVALEDDGRLVLLRQYRYALDRVIWEIPAGTLESGEAPIACARRELAEEAGVVADRWEPLGKLTLLPGYSDEILHLFLARGLSPTARHLDADEVVEVERLPWPRAFEMIREGVVTDAKTVAGLFLARERIGEGRRDGS